MRVRLIKKKTIESYSLKNAGSRNSLNIWLGNIKFADWEKPSDISDLFGSADLLARSSQRVVFDIAGNDYRMICKYHFGTTSVRLYIKWLGTHAEYTGLCRRNQQFTINIY